jgi:hypothetical protein
MSVMTHALKKNTAPAIVPARISPMRSFELSRNTDAPLASVSHQFNQLAIKNPSQTTQACPLSIADPRACPTGGACHLCPGRN